MKLKASSHLLLSIDRFHAAARQWVRVMLRTPSHAAMEHARRIVRQMVAHARACLEVWAHCNAPLHA